MDQPAAPGTPTLSPDPAASARRRLDQPERGVSQTDGPIDAYAVGTNGHTGETQEPWTPADAAALYAVNDWGAGYFSVNDAGHVAVSPKGAGGPAIDLYSFVDELRGRDIALPVLVRFTDILQDRMAKLAGAFANAIAEHDFKGTYRCVYPIKVNQQRHVVEEIHEFGKEHGFGLEAGSKPELLAVMAIVDDDATPIVCNGFKDDEFIEAVILATKVGRTVIPVVEKFSELELIVKHAKRHGVRPRIGVRVKLAALGAGRWQQSGGVRSKFGLFISEIIEALEYLRKHGMGDCLSLLHFHLGSQINNISNIKGAIVELVRVYTELNRMGADLQYLDVGGGLGVDYDGSRTNFESSINYGLQEYANDVVFFIRQGCDEAGARHPTIISESGRAMVAYHSVLVFDVIGWSGFARFDLPETISDEERRTMPMPVRNLFGTYKGLNKENLAEYYHDATRFREDALNAFSLGYCSLEHRSLAERLYFGLCSKVLAEVRKMPEVPDEFADLEAAMSDTYFCNMSIFQSMPDAWAIDQLFPIMPIHRLDEKPTCRGILADITCDSDGKIDRFIDRRDVKSVLELHEYKHEDYCLGAFLVGAYQEILGDLHNLLGDTNAVHVTVGDDGRANVDEFVAGDTVREVLQYVQYDGGELLRSMRKVVEKALKEKKISIDEGRVLLKFYESGLDGYTYLE